MSRTFLLFLSLIFLFSYTSVGLGQGLTVFKCKFPDVAFYITIDEEDLSARIGASIGIGNYGQAYFDELYKIWIAVESVAVGSLPSTLTTIKPDGTAIHSRHTIFSAEKVLASQTEGNCTKL